MFAVILAIFVFDYCCVLFIAPAFKVLLSRECLYCDEGLRNNWYDRPIFECLPSYFLIKGSTIITQ